MRYQNLPTATFTVTATDAQDGNISGNVSYVSSIDGPVTAPAQLSPGIHVIHAVVTDSDGNTGSDRLVLTVDGDVDVSVDTAFHNPAGITFHPDAIAEVNATSPFSLNWFFMNKARNTGKFAFEYKQLTGGLGTSRLGIVRAGLNLGAPGIAPFSYAYLNNARKAAANVETVIGTPTTEVGESILFMVDLDAGTIRIRGTGDSASTLLYSGLSFSESGMLPGFAVSGLNTKIQYNMDGPFAIPADPGYLPWESTQNLPPTLQLTSAGTEFITGQNVPMSGTSLDPEQGDLSNMIVWSSSVSGALGTGASITPVLSIGNQTITASVSDNNSATVTQTLTFVHGVAYSEQPAAGDYKLATRKSGECGGDSHPGRHVNRRGRRQSE